MNRIEAPIQAIKIFIL